MELPVQVTTDEIHAHARHTGHRFLDLVLALSAIFISVVSLVVAIEHGQTERELVAANSWPFVQVDKSLGGPDGDRLWLSNSGIGPAKLESFEVLYKGAVMPTLRVLLERCCGLSAAPIALRKAQLAGLLPTYGLKNTVMRPGESDTFLTVRASQASDDMADRMNQAIRSVSFRACYCSVFDECWLSNLQDLHPERVAACPVNDRSFNSEDPPR